MRKTAFVVEKDFLENGHYGVRNFFSTIKKVIEDMGEQADYLTFRRKSDGGLAWYKITPRYIRTPEDSYLEYFDGWKEKINYSRLERLLQSSEKSTSYIEVYRQSVGDSMKNESYDTVFLTEPWMYEEGMCVYGKKIVGIVYDIIPNLYAITQKNPPFSFAYHHLRGYQFYNDVCDYIMADSKESIRQYETFFHGYVRKGTCSYFKPFVPYDVGKEEYQEQKRERAIILSAPFDLRKGLKDMPFLLNYVSDCLDTLYIYGRPRCSPQDFNEFFERLNVRHIVYYPYISSKKLADIYQKCKFLFFPSKQEGLGLPILEAQVHGCRVIVRNLPPMNELGLEGAIYLEDSMEDQFEFVKAELVGKNFSHEQLAKHARQLYLYDDIRDFIKEAGRFRGDTLRRENEEKI